MFVNNKKKVLQIKINRYNRYQQQRKRRNTMITLEKNTASNKYKHIIVYKDQFVKMTIGNFTNKKHAQKMTSFLNWYQNRFGEFLDYEEASVRLLNAANQSNINFIGC